MKYCKRDPTASSANCQSLPKETHPSFLPSFLVLPTKCFLLPFGLINRKPLVRDLLRHVLPLLKAKCLCRCFPETSSQDSELQVMTLSGAAEPSFSYITCLFIIFKISHSINFSFVTMLLEVLIPHFSDLEVSR